MAWREARAKSAFKMYEPHLKKMIEIKKQIAAKIGYEKHPYNALLDTFEEQLTVNDLDKIFDALTPRIQTLLKKLVDSNSPFCKANKLAKSKYDINKVNELNHDILTLLQYDMKRFRMDISTHPFTETMGLNDIRITTRYEGIDFKKSIFIPFMKRVTHCIIYSAINHCLFLPLKAELHLDSMNLSQGFGRTLCAEVCLLFN